MKGRLLSVVALFTIARAGVYVLLGGESPALVPLFPKDGVPEGWLVRRWDDVSKPADGGVVWKVEGGILQGFDNALERSV